MAQQEIHKGEVWAYLSGGGVTVVRIDGVVELLAFCSAVCISSIDKLPNTPSKPGEIQLSQTTLSMYGVRLFGVPPVQDQVAAPAAPSDDSTLLADLAARATRVTVEHVSMFGHGSSNFTLTLDQLASDNANAGKLRQFLRHVVHALRGPDRR